MNKEQRHSIMVILLNNSELEAEIESEDDNIFQALLKDNIVTLVDTYAGSHYYSLTPASRQELLTPGLIPPEESIPKDTADLLKDMRERSAWACDVMVRWVREQLALDEKTARIETAEQIAIAIRNLPLVDNRGNEQKPTA